MRTRKHKLQKRKRGGMTSLKRLKNWWNGIVNISGPLAKKQKKTIKIAYLDDTVTQIENKAFFFCKNLITVSLLERSQLSSIGEEAFAYCENLKNFGINTNNTDGEVEYHIPNTVTFIGKGAFKNCEHLTSIIIPETITELEDEVFMNCKGLQNVVLPSRLTKIGHRTFFGCSNLETVTLPQGLILIGNNAFAYCRHLQSVNSETVGECIIPHSVEMIGKFAFEVTNFNHVKISNPGLIIGENSFTNISVFYAPEEFMFHNQNKIKPKTVSLTKKYDLLDEIVVEPDESIYESIDSEEETQKRTATKIQEAFTFS